MMVGVINGRKVWSLQARLSSIFGLYRPLQGCSAGAVLPTCVYLSERSIKTDILSEDS